MVKSTVNISDDLSSGMIQLSYIIKYNFGFDFPNNLKQVKKNRRTFI